MEYGLADMNKKSVTGIARYRTKADGTLYVNEWYIPENDNYYRYYYGEGGKAYTGFRTVHGKSYYFNGSSLVWNEMFYSAVLML